MSTCPIITRYVKRLKHLSFNPSHPQKKSRSITWCIPSHYLRNWRRSGATKQLVRLRVGQLVRISRSSQPENHRSGSNHYYHSLCTETLSNRRPCDSKLISSRLSSHILASKKLGLFKLMVQRLIVYNRP